MSSLTFRKEDAPSCLVVDTTFGEVLDKPEFFTELATRIVDIMLAAEETGQLTRPDTFMQVKEALNKVLLRPLQAEYEGTEDIAVKKTGSILVDAFWDEISNSNDGIKTKVWQNMKTALNRAYEMKMKIADHEAIDPAKDALQDVKNNVNDVILKPMLGIN